MNPMKMNTKTVNGNIILVLTVNCSGGDQRNDYEWKETHCFTIKGCATIDEAWKKMLKPSYIHMYKTTGIPNYAYDNLRKSFKEMLKQKFGITNSDMFHKINVYGEPEVDEIDF